MALKRVLQLHTSQKKYLVGINNYIETRLTPTVVRGVEMTPHPNTVRAVLSGARRSKRLLLDIFENGTDLMQHPCVCSVVKKAFETWRKTGKLPESYGDWRKK